jgi:predicted porin
VATTGAFAQSSVTLFGTVDAGVQNVKQNNVSKTQLTSSGNASSALGFKGTEDLGGGMTASFHLESGLTNDNGSTAFNFARRSTLDLAGNFGAVRLGRDYTPTFWNHTVFDPFGTLGSGAGSNITGKGQNATTAARTNNGVSYLYGFAPNAASAQGSGVYAQLTHAFAENTTGTTKTNQYQGVRVGYANGPLNVAVAAGNVVTGVYKDKEMNVGASYDLGMANVMAKFGTNTVGGATDLKYTWTSIGAKVPLGNGYIPVSFNTSKNNADSAKANQLAVGYVYNLSKRTAAYTTYSKISNKNGAGYGFNGGNGGFASGLNATGNGTGFDIGLRHTF